MTMSTYRFSGVDAAKAQAELAGYFGPLFDAHAGAGDYGFRLTFSISLGLDEDQCRWGVFFTFDTGDHALDVAAREFRDTFSTQDDFVKAIAREAAGMLMAGVSRRIGGRHLVNISR